MGGSATYAVCVGATKAGTSWLYSYLQGHPDCGLRSIKELHYFDTLEHNAFDVQIDKARTRLARLEEQDAESKLRDQRDWLNVLEGRGASIDAYRGYLDAGRVGRKLVADITPAYALLPEARLAQIAGFAEDVRVIYLLRDPVDRLWSQLRMNARRRLDDLSRYERKARKLLDAALEGGEQRAVIRGDYAGALARLDATVAPDRLLVMFQDTLFTPEGLQRLCDFLGIARRPADMARRVHEGVAAEMRADQRARAAHFLRPQYEAVARRMGPLPTRWQQHMEMGVAA